MLKRAIEASDSDPHLNFWRIIIGNQLDVAVLEWCKIFGSNNEATHWKQVIPEEEHATYKAELLAMLIFSEAQWNEYWKHMKAYRDNLVAHHINGHNVAEYPDLTPALESAAYHYKYILPRIRELDKTPYPDDLLTYQIDFHKLALEVAAAALNATKNIPESVR